MRTLRRPLFRGGSTGTGITSGLAPKRGRVDGPGGYAGDEWKNQKLHNIFGGDMTVGQAQELSKQMAYKPRGTNVYDFLTEFGLNIASTPPQGNIISTAAAAAKDPYSKFLSRKGEAEASKYVSEADMFKTLIKAGATAQGDTGLAGKTEQWKHEKVPEYMNTIMEMEKIDVDKRTDDQQVALDSARFNLERMRKDNPFISFFLDNKKLAEALVKKIRVKLIKEDQQSATPVYDQELGEDDPQLIIDSFLEFKKQVREMSKAEGGRIGYQNAGPVLGQGLPAQTPTTEETMPEELGNISYEELRARLPQEVGDEIVRLLANSAEALEDFATIQTEQDISNFNKKYGVNLVLPAEA